MPDIKCACQCLFLIEDGEPDPDFTTLLARLAIDLEEPLRATLALASLVSEEERDLTAIQDLTDWPTRIDELCQDKKVRAVFESPTEPLERLSSFAKRRISYGGRANGLRTPTDLFENIKIIIGRIPDEVAREL
jgi:hypothetical protein